VTASLSVLGRIRAALHIDGCIAFYAPDHQIRSRPGPKGRSEIKAFLENTHRAWPDIQIVVGHAVAEGDWVMRFGVQPTHKRIETSFWDMHRFNDDGLIVETWNLMDSLSIMGQLGLLPGPA
jgi:predicted SnoaL-like aldol condensation-catalyzing enzyme